MLSEIRVSCLQRKGIHHGNLRPRNVFIKDGAIPKLGPCNFVLDEDMSGNLNANMQDLAKLLLYCSTGGSYEVSEQEDGRL